MSSVHDGSEGKDTQLPLSTTSSSPYIRTSAFPPSSFSSSPPSLSSTSMNISPQPTRSRTAGVRRRSRSASLSVQLDLDPFLASSSSSRIPTVSRRMSHGLQRVNSSVIPEDSPILTSSPPSISSGINVKKPTYPTRGGSYSRSRHTSDIDYVSEGSDIHEQDDTYYDHEDPNEYEYEYQPTTNDQHSSTRTRRGSIEQSRHRTSYRSRSSSISTFPFPSSKLSSSSPSSKSSLTRKLSLVFLIILALFLIGTIIVLSTVRHYFGIPESADLTERDVLWDHGKGNIREFQQEKYGLHDHFNLDSIEDGVAIEDLGHGNANAEGNGIWGKEGKGSGGYWMKRNWNGVVGETTSWQRLYNVTNL